jgi:2-polyprenyl-3-methyl-5-hydroxy-6-metoxy-1,4-benzoquinol methylase
MEKRRRVQDLVGQADIDLIDLFLKGYFKSGHKVLDVGCGEGRNLQIFIDSNVEYYGLDKSGSAIKMAKMLLRAKDSNFDEEQIQTADLIENPFPKNAFDWVTVINVLQHCKSMAHFKEMASAISQMARQSGSVFIKSTTRNDAEPIPFVINEEAITILKSALPKHSSYPTVKKSLKKEELVMLFRPVDQDL